MWSWLKNLFSPYAKHIDPPVTACADRTQAWLAACAIANPVAGDVVITSGTPSMVPLIPAAPTWLAVKPIPFSEIRLGIVGIYRSPLSPTGVMCHRLTAHGDATGYIASGDNNRYSEPRNYVRAENFLGEVIGIFTFPNSPS